MEPENKQQELQKYAMIREMERRSLDSFMVFNPTSEDYLVEWDKRYHRIPNKDKNMGFGNGRMELPRYLAEKYARDMKNKLINAENDQMLLDLKDKLAKAGVTDPVLNANLEFERRHERRTDNPELIKKYYEILLLGLVREYGLDMPDAMQSKHIDPAKTVEEQILETMSQRYQEPTNGKSIPKAQPVKVQEVKEKPSLEEVTA